MGEEGGKRKKRKKKKRQREVLGIKLALCGWPTKGSGGSWGVHLPRVKVGRQVGTSTWVEQTAK